MEIYTNQSLWSRSLVPASLAVTGGVCPQHGGVDGVLATTQAVEGMTAKAFPMVAGFRRDKGAASWSPLIT